MSKSAKRILTIAAVGIAAYYALQWFTRRTVAKISYAAGGFRVHKIDFSSVEFRIGMTVTNESDVPATVTGFLGRLVYAWPDKPASVLGDLTLVEPKEIPGFGRVDLEFRMVSGLFGAGFEILNILTDGHPTDFSAIDYSRVAMNRFKILGTLKVLGFPVDVDSTLAGSASQQELQLPIKSALNA